MKLKDVAIIEKIQAYIEKHLKDDILIETLTDKFSINRAKLQKLFKELLSDTVKDYITKQKIYYGADRLVNSDDTILKIAERLGITKSYFHTRFKAEYHCTPNQFRQQHRATPTLSTAHRSRIPAKTPR